MACTCKYRIFYVRLCGILINIAMKRLFLLLIFNLCVQCFSLKSFAQQEVILLPDSLPIPNLPDIKPVGTVDLGASDDYPEATMDFPIWTGVYKPSWEGISQPYPQEIEWLREAKFGFWVHFGPQAAGMSGDWYARRLYQPDMKAYESHLKNYGHPSETGYKDVLRTWNPTELDPEAYVKLFHESGARYLFILGVHHDNYDLWDSKYQPWNSVNIGAKRDIVGEWAKAVKKHNMHYGITFHHEYTWWWWQNAFNSDTSGEKKGVPYDGRLVYESSKGEWWENYDLRLLYGINLREYKGVDSILYTLKEGIFTNHQEYAQWYATQWALRIQDAVEKYDPDFIYTDGNSFQPFSGYKTGTGFKSNAVQRVIASFYNRAMKKHGDMDVFSIVKFHPAGRRGIVTTFENQFPEGIKRDQMWIGEAPVGDWFYGENFVYSATSVIRYMLECVSRDGNCAVNIPIKPDGSMEENCILMLKDIGEWMRINAEGIYGSRAWQTFGESASDKITVLPKGAKLDKRQEDVPFQTSDFRFTFGKDGSIYAYCMVVPQPNETIQVKSLDLLKGKIKKVELLGSSSPVKWKQDAQGLHIQCPKTMNYKIAVCFRISM
jgi:alpha-L-fucosidase